MARTTRVTEAQLKRWAQDDGGIAALVAAQQRLLDDMQTARLGHMAESFGRPGGLTPSGQRYKAAAERWDRLNLAGMLYLVKTGRITTDDIDIDPAIFATA